MKGIYAAHAWKRTQRLQLRLPCALNPKPTYTFTSSSLTSTSSVTCLIRKVDGRCCATTQHLRLHISCTVRFNLFVTSTVLDKGEISRELFVSLYCTFTHRPTLTSPGPTWRFTQSDFSSCSRLSFDSRICLTSCWKCIGLPHSAFAPNNSHLQSSLLTFSVYSLPCPSRQARW